MCTSRIEPPEAVPDTAALLARTARLGEYFALPNAADSPGPTWHLMSTLLQEAPIRDLVERTRRATATTMRCEPGDIPVRLAASSFQLGVASRLISPLIGAAVCSSAVPLLDRDSLWWRRAGHSAVFAVGELRSVAVANPDAAAEVIADALSALFGPFNARLSDSLGLSPKISWGNVASAANGAVTVLSMTYPQCESSGRVLVRKLLDTTVLSGTGAFDGAVFTRRSCCLFYQLPGSGYCGDCLLSPALPHPSPRP